MKRQIFLLSFTLSLVLFPLAPSGFSLLYSQWSTDPSQNLQVSSWGLSPDACTDGPGGVYISWLSFDYDHSQVYLQRVDKWGYVQWNPPLLIGELGNFQFGKANVIEDGFGNAIVAYNELTIVDTIGSDPIYESKVLIQKVDSLGNTLLPGNGVRVSLDTTDQGFLGTFNLVPDSAGGVIVLWNERDHFFSDTTRRYIQRISHNGQRLWGENGVLIYNDLGNNEPLIISDELKGVILHYWTGNEYQFERVDSLGNKNWTKISPIGYNKIISNGISGAIIMATDYLMPFYRQIIVNQISNEGTLLWNENGIALSDSLYEPVGQRIAIALAKNDDESTIFTWSEFIEDSVKLKAQRVSYSGDVLWNTGGIFVTDAVSSQHYPSIVESDSSTNIVIWQDSRNGNSEYAQKLNIDGSSIWSEDKIISTRFFIYKQVVSDQKDGAIIVWSDEPINGIFAQQINHDGHLGVVITGIRNPKEIKIPQQIILHQNYPNPFNSTTIISYTIPHKSEIDLIIYNVLGEVIYQAHRFHAHPGKYEIQWKGKNKQGEIVSSGIYLYQLKNRDYQQTRKLIYLK